MKQVRKGPRPTTARRRAERQALDEIRIVYAAAVLNQEDARRGSVIYPDRAAMKRWRAIVDVVRPPARKERAR